MAVEVTPDRIRHTAELARLSLREDEIAPFAAQLQDILKYIAELQHYDTVGVPPTTHVIDLALPLRADVPAAGIARDVALAQAPRSELGAFVVPQFVAE
jgi:aspartyl-tRNA(Asn)/glutamyl-tRNA(Gln) amidotransferase subunit C